MKLSDIAEVRGGRTFKNGIPNSNNPSHSVIQLRDFDKDNELRPIKWEQMRKTDLSTSKVDNSLKEDDVLILAKGPIKKAIYLNTVPKNVVATQHFFVIRVAKDKPISPIFLAYYLNSSEAQRWMFDNSSGSYQSAINKKVLSDLPVPDISEEHQELITEAINNAYVDIQIHQRLIKGREQEVESVFKNIWKELK